MPFESPFPIPANTTQADPAEITLSLYPGTVTLLGIEFPDGCFGLVHIEAYHWDVKLWPENKEGNFSGNDVYVIFEPNYRLVKQPCELVFKGWNEDDTFSHQPIIRLEVIESGGTLVERMARLFTLGG